MNKIILSTGTNLGNRRSHLQFAIEEIQINLGKILNKSSIYESEAWGETDQQDFLNQVLEVETELNAFECLKVIQSIEGKRLRERKKHWGPRTLDIDILFFNEEIYFEKKLIIPHLFMAKRLFVLLPLSEICESYLHPVLGLSIKQILTNCEDKSKVEVFNEL